MSGSEELSTSTSGSSVRRVLIEVLSLQLVAFVVLGSVGTGLRNSVGIFSSIIFSQLFGFIGVGVVYLYMRYDSPVDEIGFGFGFTKVDMLYVGVVAVASILLNLGAYFGSLHLGIEGAQNAIAPYIEESTTNVYVFAIISLLVVGPAEEFFYRGIIQERFKDVMSPRVAIVGTSIIFALIHITSMIGSDPAGFVVYLVVLFGGSVLLGYAFEKRGTLVVPVLAHGLYNAVVVLSTLVI